MLSRLTLGEYSWNPGTGVEVCRPFLNILTLVQTQKMAFSIPIFRPGALFLESPDIFSGPESGVVFAVFVFKITLSKIFGKFCNKTIS